VVSSALWVSFRFLSGRPGGAIGRRLHLLVDGRLGFPAGRSVRDDSLLLGRRFVRTADRVKASHKGNGQGQQFLHVGFSGD